MYRVEQEPNEHGKGKDKPNDLAKASKAKSRGLQVDRVVWGTNSIDSQRSLRLLH